MAILGFLHKQENKTKIVNRFEGTREMTDALNYVGDLSHATERGFCTFSINNNAYSCAIDVIATFINIDPHYKIILSQYNKEKDNKIAMSVAGQTTVQQMSDELNSLRHDLNILLEQRLFGNIPKSYPFCNLIEFLKLSESDESAKIEYCISVNCKEQNSRTVFLSELGRLSNERFARLRVESILKDSLTLRF